jgi:signal transduction histidine kinase
VSIYNAPDYIKQRLIIGDTMEDQRQETVDQIRKSIAAMSPAEKRGLSPAAIEKALAKIETQLTMAESSKHGNR